MISKKAIYLRTRRGEPSKFIVFEKRNKNSKIPDKQRILLVLEAKKNSISINQISAKYFIGYSTADPYLNKWQIISILHCIKYQKLGMINEYIWILWILYRNLLYNKEVNGCKSNLNRACSIKKNESLKSYAQMIF